jgi:uncharacterized integral membrane protein (TIGR00698 family)
VYKVASTDCFQWIRRILFFLLLGLSAWWNSPPTALVLGLALGLSVGHPYKAQNRKLVKTLLQLSVIGLGFGMDLRQVLSAGLQGLGFTALSIVLTLILGFFLGKLLGLRIKPTHLIASGTAICGGSAIAAIGPILQADEQDMSVALGTIFVLNAIALLIFPPIGQWAHFNETQFGWWCAIAIHDTSSVVGAAAKFGPRALEIATTVKLARALWIVPLALLTSFWLRRWQAAHEKDVVLALDKPPKVALPYFILFFLLASLLQTYWPVVHGVATALFSSARLGLTITLFLIGAGLSRESLKEVGLRPLLLGLMLWLLVAGASFWVVQWTIR